MQLVSVERGRVHRCDAGEPLVCGADPLLTLIPRRLGRRPVCGIGREEHRTQEHLVIATCPGLDRDVLSTMLDLVVVRNIIGDLKEDRLPAEVVSEGLVRVPERLLDLRAPPPGLERDGEQPRRAECE